MTEKTVNPLVTHASQIGKGSDVSYGQEFSSLIGFSSVLFIRIVFALLLLILRPVIPEVVASDWILSCTCL